MTMLSNKVTMVHDMGRAKLIGVRLDATELARLERLQKHFTEKYPGVEITVSAAIKIALTLVERAELGAPLPPAEPSRPRLKSPRKR